MKTRHKGLEYTKVSEGDWRFMVDGSHVGSPYPTKAELLADAERQAQDRGFAPRDPLAQLGARVLEIHAMSYDRAYDECDAKHGSRWAASPMRGPYEFLTQEAARSLGLLDGEVRP